MPSTPRLLATIAVLMPDQRAARIDQRAARIAYVDRRIGLDEILERCDAQLLPPGRAHDAVRHRLRKPDGVADRQHDVADLEPVGAAERHDRDTVLEIDAQHRQVGVGIAADDARIGDAPVRELHADRVGIRDHVVVCDDVPWRIDDHAGSQASLDALLIQRPVVAEKLVEARTAPPVRAPAARCIC